MSMFEIKVVISGPGGVVNYDATLIRRALMAAGIRVTTINDHPIESGQRETEDEFISRVGDLEKEHDFHDVRLVVKHEPWGG